MANQRESFAWTRAWWVGAIALPALMLLTRPAAAQMEFDLDETEEAPAEEAEEEAPTEESEPPAPEGDMGMGDDLIGELAGPEDMSESQRESAPRPTETAEEIYAVQQIFALRINRLEVAPSAAFTVNDPYVFRPAIGVALNYWWTNVLAIGLNFLWYQGLGNARDGGQDLNFHVRRSTRLAVPITEWQLGANLNFTYVPLYGKFSMFNEFIFQWDAYVVGGVGLMRTRPIPVVDPTVREFEFGNRVAFNAGLGIRVFLSQWLSIFTEIRDYIYLEKLENREVALGRDRIEDRTTWLSGNELTNNVSVHVGLTIFFPFTFDYHLPK